MEVTRDLKSLNLLAKLMALHRQILFSVAITAIAGAILMRTSAEQVQSLHRVAPSWSFMLISVLTLFVLLVMI